MRAWIWLFISFLVATFSGAFAAQDRLSPFLKTEKSKPSHIPEWVTRTPVDCYVGISAPCETIDEARQLALNSAVSQILQAMGAEYKLRHESTLSVTRSYLNHDLEEQLAYNAGWFINSVQQNTKQSAIEKIGNRYVYFVLVRVLPKEIEHLKRLTIGPKIAARIMNEENSQLVIEVKETNSVQATLTDYHVTVTTKNHHAGIITMFAWKVPDSSYIDFEGTIYRRISINGNACTFTIAKPSSESTFMDRILGAQKQIKIFLYGHDEIGRTISVSIKYH